MKSLNISRLSMAGFAFPAMPLAAFIQAMYFFLTPLYATEMGLGTAVVGGIFFTAKMWDVVTDPLFGVVSDKFETRWGRRRPWLVIGMVIMVIAIYMLFMPKGEVGASYFLGWLVFMYVGWTMTTVSHTAWALELSQDYDQRTRVTGWLQISVMIGLMLVAVTPAILEQLGTPTHAEKTQAVAWLLMILLPVSVFVCLRSLAEPKAPPPQHIGFRRALAIVLGNGALLRLLAANAAITAAFAVVQSLFVFYVTYTLGLGARTAFILFFLMVGGTVFIPAWIRLSERYSKHVTMQLAVVYGLFAPVLLLFLPAGELWLAVPAFLLVGAITSAHELLPRTMMADVCDYDQVESGSERMGLYYSLLQLSSKLAGGLMLGSSYTVLAWIGFVPGGENTQAAIEGVRYLIVFLPVAAYLLVLLLMWRYPIDRSRQKELRQIIDSRAG